MEWLKTFYASIQVFLLSRTPSKRYKEIPTQKMNGPILCRILYSVICSVFCCIYSRCSLSSLCSSELIYPVQAATPEVLVAKLWAGTSCAIPCGFILTIWAMTCSVILEKPRDFAAIATSKGREQEKEELANAVWQTSKCILATTERTSASGTIKWEPWGTWAAQFVCASAGAVADEVLLEWSRQVTNLIIRAASWTRKNAWPITWV